MFFCIWGWNVCYRSMSVRCLRLRLLLYLYGGCMITLFCDMQALFPMKQKKRCRRHEAMEVLAVRAPDGTIRTAFNTCQVCYASGRGYFVQTGTLLVCQNCGNRYRMNQVERQAGGCNPVPIFPANKTVTSDTITISREYLRRIKVMFESWRRN